ncbi:hypothetical protein AAMO2058_000556900 [Amorphochlora amoebiformis]
MCGGKRSCGKEAARDMDGIHVAGRLKVGVPNGIPWRYCRNKYDGSDWRKCESNVSRNQDTEGTYSSERLGGRNEKGER